jgi:hypothetical protein
VLGGVGIVGPAQQLASGTSNHFVSLKKDREHLHEDNEEMTPLLAQALRFVAPTTLSSTTTLSAVPSAKASSQGELPKGGPCLPCRIGWDFSLRRGFRKLDVITHLSFPEAVDEI